MRVALFGADVATAYTTVPARIPRVEFTAIVDRDLATTRRIAGLLGAQVTVEPLDSLLDRNSSTFDAVLFQEWPRPRWHPSPRNAPYDERSVSYGRSTWISPFDVTPVADVEHAVRLDEIQPHRLFAEYPPHAGLSGRDPGLTVHCGLR